MIRKLFLLAVCAVAAFALSAVSASAQETVHNPGEFEIESEVDIAVVVDHPTFGHVPQLQCDNHWFAQINSAGVVHLPVTDIEISPHASPPSVGQCATAEACAEWDGQIEETLDGGFETHLTFCLTGTQNEHLENIPKTVECAIEPSGDVIHCDYRILEGNEETGGLPIEIEGEVFLDHPLELEHS